MTVDPNASVKNYRRAGGAQWDIGGKLEILSGGVLNIEAGGDLQVAGASVIGSVATGGVAGVAAGYALARGSTAVTGATGGDVATGMSTVTGVAASLGEDATLAGLFVTVAIAAAGHITIKVWKPTASGDVTPILATAAKQVNWVAVGTP